MKKLASEQDYSDTFSTGSEKSTSETIPIGCHLYPKFVYGSRDIFLSRIHRTYFHTFKINGTIYQFYKGIAAKPLKIVKNMKYTQKIIISRALDVKGHSSKDACELLRKLHRTSSIHIKFGSMYKWKQQTVLRRVRTIIKSIRSNLSKMDIQISFVFKPEDIIWNLSRIFIDFLKRLHNLKSLSLTMKEEVSLAIDMPQENKSLSNKEKDLISLYQQKFQRVRSIENLCLRFFLQNVSPLSSFTRNLARLKKLKSLEVASSSELFSRKLFKDIKDLEHLTSMIVYYPIDICSFFSLLKVSKSLRTVIIRCSSINEIQNESLTKSIKSTEINLNCLHLDFPLIVKTEKHAEFIANIFALFHKIEDLKVYLSCTGHDQTFSHILKVINNLRKLKILALGFEAPVGSKLAQEFSLMNSIVNLEKLVLVTEIASGSDKFFEVLPDFVARNKSIRVLEIYWKESDILCVQQIRKTLKRLPIMEFFSISYITSQIHHNCKHEQILEELGKALEEALYIKKVKVCTACDYIAHPNCDLILGKMKKKIDKKHNIDEFVFTNTLEIKTPFHNYYLSTPESTSWNFL